MHLVIPQSDAIRELQLLMAVVDRKITIPVLAGVHLTALASGDVRCVATNVDNTLAVLIRASEVSASGAAVVPLDTLLGLLSRFPVGDVALALVKDRARLTAAGASADLPTFPLEDFPPRVPAETPMATVPAAVLLALLRGVKHAMGESTYFPAGANCKIADGRIRLAATDSYRIAVASAPLPEPASGASAFSISDRAWEALTKVLHEEPEDATVTLARSDNAVTWATPTRALTARVLDREFPQFERVLPTTTAFTVEIPIEALRATLRRHVVLTSMDACKTVFRLADGCLHLATTTVRGAAADVVRGIEPALTETFALNPKYVLDTLDALETETAQVSLAPSGHASIWRRAEDPDALMATISTMRV